MCRNRETDRHTYMTTIYGVTQTVFFWLNRDVLVIYKSYQFRFFPLGETSRILCQGQYVNR